MKDKKINKCQNGHYFLEDNCPHCGCNAIEKFELRNGDCVYCGQLCPDGGYACNSPYPIKLDE